MNGVRREDVRNLAGEVAGKWADTRPRTDTLASFLKEGLAERGYGLQQGIHVVERVMATGQSPQTVVIHTGYSCGRMFQDEIFAHPGSY